MLQLCERNKQLQQAIDGTQLMQRVLERSGSTTDRSQILQLTIDELSRTLEASYCWAALHDEADLTSKIVCESVRNGFKLPESAIGTRIDLEKHSRFYFRLFQRESWLDPSANLLPPLYRQLQTIASQMLICPIQDEQRVIGEVGILTQNASMGSKLQADLIAQIVSHQQGFRNSPK
ncbi:hypothetical protein [Phormidesmis priestleyi]